MTFDKQDARSAVLTAMGEIRKEYGCVLSDRDKELLSIIADSFINRADQYRDDDILTATSVYQDFHKTLMDFEKMEPKAIALSDMGNVLVLENNVKRELFRIEQVVASEVKEVTSKPCGQRKKFSTLHLTDITQACGGIVAKLVNDATGYNLAVYLCEEFEKAAIEELNLQEFIDTKYVYADALEGFLDAVVRRMTISKFATNCEGSVEFYKALNYAIKKYRYLYKVALDD